MNKKMLWIPCLWLLLVSTTTLAATGMTTQIQGDVFNQAGAQVQNIEINFCESFSKTKEYMLTAGKPTDICFEAENISDKDILVSLDFVDGTFTNDQRKNRACMDNNQKEKFGQYVFWTEKTFTLPAKGRKIITGKILYPSSTTWSKLLGCMVYYTKWVSAGEDLDFSILVRRAKFIDLTIKQSFVVLYKRYIVGWAVVLLIVLGSILRKKKSKK